MTGTSKGPTSAVNMLCLILCCTLFLVGSKQFHHLFEMKVPKFQHSSSAEAAAAADNISIANAFVSVLFTLGCVGVQLLFCHLVNLKVLSQANLHGRSLQGSRSTIPSDTPTQYLVLGVFLYFICRSSLLVYRNYQIITHYSVYLHNLHTQLHVAS